MEGNDSKDIVRTYDIQTDWGRMVFTSDDVVGYWWERLDAVGGNVSKLFVKDIEHG